MKIVYTEGCTCFGIDIDNRDITDLSDPEIKEIANKIFQQFNRSELEEFIRDSTINQGDSEYQYTCDQCGDSVYTYTLEI